jgi:intein/homing endonuclease
MIKRRLPGNSSAFSQANNQALGSRSKGKINVHEGQDGRMVETANFGGQGLQNTSMSNNVISLDLFPLLKGVIPDGYENFPLLNNLYRDIYYHDSVCGSAVDLMSFMPFSDMTLGGVETADKDKLKKFYESLDRINVRRLLPELSVDYLTLGTFIGSLVFNKQRGVFTDVIPHDIDHCSISPLPFYSQDPIINVSIAKETIAALGGNSKRIQRIKKKMGDDVISKLMSGKFELDNLTTLYVPRRTLSAREGISWFKRVLPIYLLEKNLFKGTIIESAKRQRSIMHITAGCLTGDTLLSVNKELVRFDKICSHKGMKPGTYQDVNFQTKGIDGKQVKATKWWYQGKKPVKHIETKSGYFIQPTDNHEVLVLSEGLNLIWRATEDLKLGDYLCLDPNVTPNKNTPLDLGIKPVQWKKTPFIYNTPKVMTPELAYIIGLTLSDGTITDSVVRIGSTEMELLLKAQECFNKVFGVGGNINQTRIAGTGLVKGKKCKVKEAHVLQVSSKFIVDIFKQIGVKTNSQLNPHNLPKKISSKKSIPWSILRADIESKYSFIAGYIDGDGHVIPSQKDTSVQLGITSYSPKMLKQFQILLIDLGITSFRKRNNLRISGTDGSNHYDNLKKYLSNPVKIFEVSKEDIYYNKYRGIPVSIVSALVESRLLHQKGERRQYTFLNDLDEEVRLDNWGKHKDRGLRGKSKNKKMVYENFGLEKYSNIFESLKLISPELVSKVEQLTKIGYVFEPIVEIKHLKKERHVYDLTIEDGKEPAFIANGIVVHNSSDWEPTINDLQFLTELFMNADADPIGAMVATRSDVNVSDIRQGGDFWNVTQVWADTVPAKLRALGISEGFLSSESNYSEAQNSMTVFIEWLAAYRYMIERKVFYDKIFPLISVVNGYYNNEKDLKKFKNSEMDPEDILYELQDNSSLIIPKIHWHKQLKPEGDSDYLGMLNTLAEAGVPVTLRSMAAAGNLSLDQLMSEMEEDIKIRKAVADLKAKLEGGAEGSGGEENYDEASDWGDRITTLASVSKENPYLSATLSKLKVTKGQGLRKLTSRSYGSDSEIKGESKTGKPKYVPKAASEKHGVPKKRKSFFPTIKLR